MIFLDTSLIVSYLNEGDLNHARAVPVYENILKNRHGEFFISDYIFDEVATVALARTKDHKKVTDFCDNLLNSELLIVKITEEIFNKGWELFKKNKHLSFTDCTSIAAMQSYRIEKIATFDEGFKKIANIEVIN